MIVVVGVVVTFVGEIVAGTHVPQVKGHFSRTRSWLNSNITYMVNIIMI